MGGGGDGSDCRTHNDVWCSTNGIDWTEVTAAPSFSKRMNASLFVFNGKLRLLAGSASAAGVDLNDIWSSTDGGSWTEETASAAFSARHSQQVVMDGSDLWMARRAAPGRRSRAALYSAKQEEPMPDSPKSRTIARCACGSVELEAIGAPILSAACYCDDCREGARQIEALPNARPVLDPDGGAAYLLYRKDRMKCSKGVDHLRDYKIKDESPTRRVVASCCNSAMFVDFQKGHWFSAYRARFEGDVPPLQMRIQTKFKPENRYVPNDVPSYPRYPLKLIAKLAAAKVAMLLHR